VPDYLLALLAEVFTVWYSADINSLLLYFPMGKMKKILAGFGTVAFALLLTVGTLAPMKPAKAAFDMTYIDAIAATGTGIMQDTATAGFHIMGLFIPTWMGIGIVFGVIAVVVGLVYTSLGGGRKIFGGGRRRR